MNQADFRQKIESAFNKGQLKTLCFDMGIDYENLPETKEGMVRELLQYCVRQNRVNELLQICREKRPTIAWPDLTDLNLTSPASERKGCTAYWGNRTISIMVFMSLFLCTSSYFGSNLFLPVQAAPDPEAECHFWTVACWDISIELQLTLFFLFLIVGFVGIVLIALITINLIINRKRYFDKALQQ
jgi:hypothetical protein